MSEKERTKMSVEKFQIGTLAIPLEILWATSEMDAGNSARGIKVYVNNKYELGPLVDLDESLISIERDRGILRLKLWQNAKVTLHGSDTKLKIDDLKSGDKIAVIAKPYQWQFEGREGVTLSCGEVLLIEQVNLVTIWK